MQTPHRTPLRDALASAARRADAERTHRTPHACAACERIAREAAAHRG